MVQKNKNAASNSGLHFLPLGLRLLEFQPNLGSSDCTWKIFKLDGAVRIEYHGENVRILYLARKVSPSIQSFVEKTFTNFPATIWRLEREKKGAWISIVCLLQNLMSDIIGLMKSFPGNHSVPFKTSKISKRRSLKFLNRKGFKNFHGWET